MSKGIQNDYFIYEDYAEIVIESYKFGRFKVKIDLDDIEKCKQYIWGVGFDKKINKFYIKATTRVEGKVKNIKLNRYILNNPKGIVKIIGDSMDYRKSNLLIGNRAEINRYAKTRKDSISGYKGIYWLKDRQRWRVHLFIKQGKNFFIGNFKTLREAILARVNAEIEFYGEVITKELKDIDIGG